MSATETYKGYLIESDKTYSLKHIRWPGKGGSIDKTLRGKFTQVMFARQAIDNFLETAKGKKNAKTENSSGTK